MVEKFPTAEELQEMFKNKIIEMINYIKDYSAYEVLSYFYSSYKMCLGEMDGKDKRWNESKHPKW